MDMGVDEYFSMARCAWWNGFNTYPGLLLTWPERFSTSTGVRWVTVTRG